MAFPLLAAGLGLQGLIGIGKAIVGADQISDGKEELSKLVRPEYTIQDEYFQNQSISQNLAQQGLPEEAMQYFTTQADRGFTAGLDVALRGGASPNSIANLYDSYNQANNRIAVEDANMRLSNIRNLMEANRVLAGQKTQKWAIDEYEPYKDAVRGASQTINNGYNNLFGGLNTTVTTLGQAATAFGDNENSSSPIPSPGSGYLKGDVSYSPNITEGALMSKDEEEAYIRSLLSFRNSTIPR
jgi:hypothetical protein